MMNLSEWHSTILSALAFLKNPAADFLPPPGGGGRERLEVLADVRQLLGPEDHALEPWKCPLERWAASLADGQRSYVLERLWALAKALDTGLAEGLASSNEEFVRTADFPNVRFFGGPVPLACGVLQGLPTGHFLQSLVDDAYILDGERALVLGFAMAGPPWRPRAFYPCDLVRRLTTDHRRVQAESEQAERQRQRVQADLERWERERNPEYQIASLQKRLAVLENS